MSKNESDRNIDALMEELERRSNPKPLHELVHDEYFTVERVVSETDPTYFTPDSEIVFGERSRGYSGGNITNIVLEVASNNRPPIKRLSFEGNSGVRAGDRILAKIPKYDERREFVEEGQICGADDTRIVYIPRQEYRDTEKAIEINIIEIGTGKVLRTDRSVEYKSFQPHK